MLLRKGCGRAKQDKRATGAHESTCSSLTAHLTG